MQHGKPEKELVLKLMPEKQKVKECDANEDAIKN